MDRATRIALDLSTVVDWFTQKVEHSTKNTFADGNGDWATRVDTGLTTSNTIGTTESDAADLSASKVLADLSVKRNLLIAEFNFRRNGVVDVG
jgi:hypothetical protein